MTEYIVWNPDFTEGFLTYDEGVARSIVDGNLNMIASKAGLAFAETYHHLGRLTIEQMDVSGAIRLLEECRDQFNFYAHNHRQKTERLTDSKAVADTLAKARVNEELADLITHFLIKHNNFS